MGVGKSCLLHQFTEKKCKPSIVKVGNNMLRNTRTYEPRVAEWALGNMYIFVY